MIPNMPATPEEMKLLVDTFENAHPPLARAMADLLLRGLDILQEHRLEEHSLVVAYEALVNEMAEQHGVSKQVLSGSVAALRRLRATVDQLDRLP